MTRDPLSTSEWCRGEAKCLAEPLRRISAISDSKRNRLAASPFSSLHVFPGSHAGTRKERYPHASRPPALRSAGLGEGRTGGSGAFAGRHRDRPRVSDVWDDRPSARHSLIVARERRGDPRGHGSNGKLLEGRVARIGEPVRADAGQSGSHQEPARSQERRQRCHVDGRPSRPWAHPGQLRTPAGNRGPA